MKLITGTIALLAASLPAFGGDDPPCTIRTVMGDPVFFSGEDEPATEARLHLPFGLVQGPDGTLYFADYLNNRIRAISPEGIIRTIAGNGEPGFSGDGGPATEAELATPTDVALDNEGNLYFVDDLTMVRKVDVSGVITTVAGTGDFEYGGDGGLATEASFAGIADIAVDSTGALYIAEQQSNRVRKVDLSGTVTTFAGDGSETFSGDGGPASLAGIWSPESLVIDQDDNVYVFQDNGWRLRRIDTAGIIQTVAGNGQFLPGEDGLPADTVPLGSIVDMTLDLDGNVLLLEERRTGVDARIRRLQDGIVTTIASQPFIERFAPAQDGGFFIAVSFGSAASSDQIRKIDADLTTVTTFAGLEQPTEDDEDPTRYRFNPQTLAVGPEGDVFVLNASNGRILRVSAEGQVTTVAGGGEVEIAEGVALGDISITSSVRDIAVDSEGRLYLSRGGRVFRAELGGALAVVAGGGMTPPRSLALSETIEAVNVGMDEVERIAIGPDDTLYLADRVGPAVRITTDGQLALLPVGRENFQFRLSDLEVGPDGTLYLSDQDPNCRCVWKLPVDGPAEILRFQGSDYKITIDQDGNFYRSEELGIKKTSSDGYQVDLTARPIPRFRFGEGRDSRIAHILGIGDLASDRDGNLFVIDSGLDRVRKITRANQCEGTRWPLVSAATHAATYERLSAISPGQIITFFGQWIGPDEPQVAGFQKSLSLPTEFHGVSVLFDDVPAPIVSVWRQQTSVIVPYEVPDDPEAIVDVDLVVDGRNARRARYRVAPAAPGLFTLDASGAGQGAILNQDLTVNGPGNPVSEESIVVLFGTGAGRTTSPLETGAIVEPPLPGLLLDVAVTVGGVPAVIAYAGPAPGLVAGVVQINAQLAPGTPTGDAVSIEWTINGVTSPPVTVAIAP